MMQRAQELEESWRTLRPGHVRGPEPIPREVLQQWVNQLGEGGSSLFLVEGPSPAHRATLCRALPTLPIVVALADHWTQGVTESIVTRRPVWRVLQDLVQVEAFFIDDPLKSIVDKGGRLTDVFKAIWEIRFLSEEGLIEEPFLRCLTDWVVTSRAPGPLLHKVGIKRMLPRHHRLEVFLFLTALSQQNNSFGKGVFILDGVEALVGLPSKTRMARFRELDRLVEVADEWSRLGAPLGFILGYSEEGCEGVKSNRFYRRCMQKHD